MASRISFGMTIWNFWRDCYGIHYEYLIDVIVILPYSCRLKLSSFALEDWR